MLTEICAYLRNYFDRGQPKFYGNFIINGGITFDGVDMATLIKNGQYIRIVGSTFNDGIYQFPADIGNLTHETFEGSIWALAIPRDVLSLADEITAWRAKYEAVDAQSMSPFSSESFGGYTYTKSNGKSVAGDSQQGWESVYGYRLSKYRKINAYWGGET